MSRYLIAGLFISHAAMHWIFRPAQGEALWLLPVLGFAAAGLGILGLGVPRSYWRPVALVSAAVSFLMLVAWHDWPWMGAGLDVAILIALLGLKWPSPEPEERALTSWLALDLNQAEAGEAALWLFSAQAVLFALSLPVDRAFFPETSFGFLALMAFFAAYVYLDALRAHVDRPWLWAALVTLLPGPGAIVYARRRHQPQTAEAA